MSSPGPLGDPLSNRGTAFSLREREARGLAGFLPPAVETPDAQVARVMANVRACASPLERYRYLASVQDSNETLFFRALIQNPEELLPAVYTPAVGEACLEWSRLGPRPRGLYLCARDAGRMAEVLERWPQRDVRAIVLTDGGRVLGLGDQGANGMAIPIGKLALYVACGGIHPAQCLPLTLDAGTDNDALRQHPFYLGLRQPRPARDAYDALVAELVDAVKRVFPRALLQFEDFGTADAFRLLERYRDALPCFNDDIQGTGAMALASLLAAERLTGARLEDQRILFFGAGSANIGIGRMIVAALRRRGLDEARARERCWYFDSQGLVTDARAALEPHKRAFAHPHPPLTDLMRAIESLRPTALFGASAQAGAFSPAVLRRMAAINRRPLVVALSNPTSKTECGADEAYRLTGGRALFASGSPCDPVTLEGRTLVPGQANNAFIFPGVGLGVVASGARRVTDEFFLAAAQALAAQVGERDLAAGTLFPPRSLMRECALAVAVAVCEAARVNGLATREVADLEAIRYRGGYDDAPLG